MTRHTNGIAQHDDLIHHRLQRLEMRADSNEDKLDDIQTNVLALRLRLDKADELDAKRHDELKTLTKQALAAQKSQHDCIRDVAKNLTDWRVLLVLALAVLVGTMTGSGLAVTVWDHFTVGPAGVSPP